MNSPASESRLPIFSLFLFCLWGGSLISLSGCTEFLSQPVGDINLSLISPADSLYASNEIVTFWWEQDQAVEQYRLQVVSPNFDNPDLIFDTLQAEDRLSLQVEEGRYEWRIRAENQGSQSAYQNRSFVIDRSPPLLPTPLYPTEGSHLSYGLEPLEIRWQSGDQAVQGISYPIVDSVYLYDQDGQRSHSFFRPSQAPRVWPLDGILTEPTVGDTLFVSYQIISIDQVGQRRAGEWVNFEVSKE